jgi:hypothetical protein
MDFEGNIKERIDVVDIAIAKNCSVLHRLEETRAICATFRVTD